MKLIPFSFLTLLAVIFAGMTVTETMMYRAMERAQEEQKNLQRKAAYYQKLNGFTEQLLRRMAVESQRDPGLAQLLKDHQIKVVVSNPNQPQDAGAAQSNPGDTTPPPTDKTSPSSH